MVKAKNKLVYGWGINDVDYLVQLFDKETNKLLWTCPYYVKWKEILRRCFSSKKHQLNPSYRNCTVTHDWKTLSGFIKWVENQPNPNWRFCEPDKDILFLGNKHYGQNTVVFLSHDINSFVLDNKGKRGEYLIGVDFSKRSNKFRSRCQNPLTKESDHLGYYATEMEAHKAWQAKKHEYACQLADLQDDHRVAKALRERYAPDKDWINK